ncbi:MAG: oligoribonuclease [Actinobacteria bacterium]|nr:oligoribonuclease [Actinomycetota bacterium]
MANENPPLIWIDCEMTGLSLENDALVEIAVLVTDDELNVLGDGVELVIATATENLAAMRDEVRAMHTESGLINEIPNGVTPSQAEQAVLNYLTAHTQAGKSPLAGNSVGMDRNFIARDMPQLNAFLHYRTVDVSSIKELARRWYPKVYFNAPKKTGNHRALGDIKDSIEELRYYTPLRRARNQL